MYRIAICDDHQSIRETLVEFVNRYFNSDSEFPNIECFSDGEDLLKSFDDGKVYDIIFLDIEMEKLDGISTGTMIRGKYDFQNTDIAYISSVENYAIKLFESRPINFLVKPLKYETVEAVLRKSLQLKRKGDSFFEFKINTSSFKVPVKDLLYFESSGRKITMTTLLDKYEFYGKLSEIDDRLRDYDFVLIHKSYLVNYQHVKESRYDSIIMTNNRKLPISQNFRTSIKLNQLTRRKK